MNTNLLPLKNLRYKPLPHLHGLTVTIPRIASVEAAVLKAVDPRIASRCKLQNATREMALLVSKYGFLDLSFSTSTQFLTPYDDLSSSTLQELGFVEKVKTQRDENDCSFLDALADGIDEGKCWFRVFLLCEPAADAIKRIFEHLRKTESEYRQGNAAGSTVFRLERTISQLADTVDQRMPRAFTIEDACLANSDAIWMASHFYL